MTQQSVPESEVSDDLLHGRRIWEIVRTDFYCTNCSKKFVAELDFSVDGNHCILCPHCLHEHCRTIEQGRVTETRWDHRNTNLDTVRGMNVWKSDSRPIKASKVSAFIREQWLERSDV